MTTITVSIAVFGAEQALDCQTQMLDAVDVNVELPQILRLGKDPKCPIRRRAILRAVELAVEEYTQARMGRECQCAMCGDDVA